MSKIIKKRAKRVAKKAVYSATIKIMGKPFSSKGETVQDALKNLNVGVAKGVSILTITKGDVSRTKTLTPPQTFRLFSASRIMREVGLKQVSNLFGL